MDAESRLWLFIVACGIQIAVAFFVLPLVVPLFFLDRILRYLFLSKVRRNLVGDADNKKRLLIRTEKSLSPGEVGTGIAWSVRWKIRNVGAVELRKAERAVIDSAEDKMLMVMKG